MLDARARFARKEGLDNYTPRFRVGNVKILRAGAQSIFVAVNVKRLSIQALSFDSLR